MAQVSQTHSSSSTPLADKTSFNHNTHEAGLSSPAAYLHRLSAKSAVSITTEKDHEKEL